jgi:hypothetical protein
MKTLSAFLFSFFIAPAALAGAWGDGSFENDDALDWVAECTHTTSVVPVSHALEAVLKGGYIEGPQGSAAIAAAEVVAAAIGKPSAKLPPELQSWVRRIPPEQLTGLAPIARKALARIRDPKASELKQLWSEGKQNNWATVVVELESRLGN